ncbi:L,D-transpeptidase family protein [Labrys wisconsinensis]|uniref:Murein L,D-transpeptidase YafK n=1 Tax=Labrys wisconsinensis TaxID=425677 RepID=A0ABU0J101_9HYPH|nr:murein L,D-transpeptidase family protein [Labrys wisconsinensis]MDQ0467931.1 murein L,D-transpeptidase YafK [Labrys wisconsinensis]
MRGTSPIPQKLLADMQAKGMTRSAPVLVRIYKQESELELWKQTNSGRYALLKTYPICRWSGQLGPKKVEGDRQVPEGFYSVAQSQMNPNSQYYLSFDVGYPNNFDRTLGRAGGDIMVHGGCSSRGCFAMTNDQMGEIYAVAREALQGGQGAFQVQSLPFRMTAENMVRNRRNPNYGFWQNLKEGADNFEVTKQPVQVAACGSRYVFNGQGGQACGMPKGDATVTAAVEQKRQHDAVEMAALAKSTPAVNTIYDDGGSNPLFAALSVDSHAIPGKDRPYSRVPRPTVVVLNESGAPATEADDKAARTATYSAAETLLMAEANLARRPVGPQKPEVVAKRQQVVYARLMGSEMPKPAAPKPEPVVVAAAEAPVAAAAPAPAADEQPFYARILSFGGSSDPAQKPATLQPSAPVEASAAGPAPAAQEERPFYQRWLGLGSDEPPAAESAPVTATVPQVSTAAVPLPPTRPKRTAVLPPVMLDGTQPALPKGGNAYATAN